MIGTHKSSQSATTAEQRRKIRAFTQWFNKDLSQRVVWVFLAIAVIVPCGWAIAARHNWPIYFGVVLLVATYPVSEIIARRWAERSFKSDSDLSTILTIGACVLHGEREPSGRFDDRSKDEVAEWTRALLTDKKWGPKVRQFEWLMEIAEPQASVPAMRS